MPLKASPLLYLVDFLLEYKNMVAIWICQVTSSFAAHDKGFFGGGGGGGGDDDDDDNDVVVVMGRLSSTFFFGGLPFEHPWIVMVVVPLP